MARLLATGVVAPVLAGVGGGVGVWAGRQNVDAAPAIVGATLLVAAAAVLLRQRGIAIAALGVGAAAAFASPAGLGPLLVATGVIVAAVPAAIDRRLARWPELFDGLVCVPGFAGLASVVAAQPSERGVALGAGAGALALLSWWRGPRRGVAEPEHESVVSYLGATGAVLLIGAPELFDVLGVLPDTTTTTGRGLAAAIAVFAVALVLPQIWALRTNRTSRVPSAAAHRR
ncbi:MAG: hypothetical protein Q8K63_10920 [Acidimicrobiales bacterium]|nr:hypothetical protein [Acidimicrobiales bacterium]